MATILGVDVSGPYVSVAVVRDTATLVQAERYAPFQTLQLLAPMIQQSINIATITLSDLYLFAITSGPGSWTGLRVGVETVKTIAQVVGVPMVGVPTDLALASNITFSAVQVATVVSAGPKHVMGSLFSCGAASPERIEAWPRMYAADFLAELSERTLVIGEGLTALLPLEEWDPARHLAAPAHLNRAKSDMVARLGAQIFDSRGAGEPLDFVPSYGASGRPTGVST